MTSCFRSKSVAPRTYAAVVASPSPPSSPSNVPNPKQKRSSDPVVLPAITEDVSTRYVPSHVLGRGAYGVVVGCTEIPTGAHYACKSIDVKRLRENADGGANVVRGLRNEIAVMAYLAGHSNVVRLHDVHETDERLVLVQEWCKGGSLRDAVSKGGGLDDAYVAHLFHGIVRSLMHCHLMGVLHRDVKPENFMLSAPGRDATVKLADFGLACFTRRGEMHHELVGSPYFMAPETLNRRTGYGAPADLWSAGVCLFQLLSGGDHPFRGSTSKDVFNALLSPEEVRFAGAWRRVPPDAIDLVRRILRKDPLHRIRLRDVLLHPWMVRHREGVVPQTPSSSGARAFVDLFKMRVEDPYVDLLKARDGAAAAVAWSAMREGLAALDACLLKHAPKNGALFLGGGQPSVAEAGTAPSLVRMNATLPAVRGMQPMAETCAGLGLTRLAQWVAAVLAAPERVCDVSPLPAEAYVRMARRLHVTYEGPITD